MITLNTENLFKVKDPQITREEFEATSKKLKNYLKKIKEKDQGFYRIDRSGMDEMIDFAAKVKETGELSEIVILGIGGSALGIKVIRDTFEDTNLRSLPAVYIMDNIDPYNINKLNHLVMYDNALILVISKSGETPEIVAQYMFFKSAQNFFVTRSPKKNFVFITGKKGFLREEAVREGIRVFDIPENVGGRFSVMTPVGLLPALLMEEINVEGLIRGNDDYTEQFLSEKFEENLSFQLAAIQYLLYQKGVNINVLIPYSGRLKTFGEWYAQLLAESIGKNGIGITPVGAVGVTDQHSQVQLYNEGPRDKLITFVEIKKHEEEDTIPEEGVNDPKFNYLKGVSFAELLSTEFAATRDAVTSYGKANITITIDKVDEYHLGGLFMLFEGAIAFLGEFFGVDAFNQPGVELGKRLTKKYLEEKK